MKGYRIEHVGIGGADPEALAAWYSSVLGFREFFRSSATPPVIFLEDGEGAWIEIFPRREGDPSPSPEERWPMHLAVAVEDFEAAVSDLEARGAKFIADAKTIFSGGRVRFFADPEGNRLHIVQRPTAPW